MSEFKDGRIAFVIYLTPEQHEYILDGYKSLHDKARYDRFCKAMRYIDDGFPIPEWDDGYEFGLWSREQRMGHNREYRIRPDTDEFRYSYRDWVKVGVYKTRPLAKEAFKEYEQVMKQKWADVYKRERMTDEEIDALTGDLRNMPDIPPHTDEE